MIDYHPHKVVRINDHTLNVDGTEIMMLDTFQVHIKNSKESSLEMTYHDLEKLIVD
jgi:hypothetical protein